MTVLTKKVEIRLSGGFVYGFIPNDEKPCLDMEYPTRGLGVQISHFNHHENIAMQALTQCEIDMPNARNWMGSWNNRIKSNTRYAKEQSDGCKDAMARVHEIIQFYESKIAKRTGLGLESPINLAKLDSAKSVYSAMQTQFAILNKNRFAINKLIRDAIKKQD